MFFYLFLGFGKQVFEFVESEIILLDNIIKEVNGEVFLEMVEVFQKRDELIVECDNLEELLEDNNEVINFIEEKFQRFFIEIVFYY